MQNSLSFVKLVKYIENYKFGEFFNDWNADDFVDYFYEASEEYREGKWHCEYGATKMVIIMDNEDIIFKIPFNSTWDFDTKQFEFFYGAPCPSTWDYCEAEEDRYNFAEDNGFSKYLAKTSMVHKTKNGVRIYIQPKCKTDSHHKTTSKRTYRTFSNWYKNTLPIDDIKWLNTFIDCYGAYKLKLFFNFLSNEGWDDDLRHDNIGYTIEGKPVLIDYSSYWEQHIDFQSLDLQY